MPSGPPICALRASGHRTSGKDCSGWPTPKTAEHMTTFGRGESNPTLYGATLMAGWPTPDASVAQDGESPETWLLRRAQLKSKHNNGNGCGMPLAMAAKLSGWPTPSASDKTNAESLESKKSRGSGGINLHEAARIAGWPTPDTNARGGAQCAIKRRQGGHAVNLQDAATLTDTGPTSNTSPAATGNRGQLNPEFVCWLMGYPAAWLSCVDWETQSSRKRPRRS